MVAGGAGQDPDQGEGVEREGKEEIEPNHANAADVGLRIAVAVDIHVGGEPAEEGAAIATVMTDVIMIQDLPIQE